MARTFYNDHEPFVCAWLRELIAEGLIAEGDVDERDIWDIKPDELRGYTQVHLFAGIGGWSRALRLAGWPDDRPIWTASCPCQPFSAAGKRRGTADERHLWPAAFHLIEQVLPDVVLGEQVASKDGLAWLDLVLSDLDGAGYSTGAVDCCAAGVGAPHIRQRLWFVAESEHADGRSKQQANGAGERGSRSGGSGELGDTSESGLQGFIKRRDSAGERIAREASVGFWSDCIWLPCRDGKARPTKPGLFPLAHGVRNRVGTLRGAGNAIAPQVAAEVIRAVMDA